MPTGDSSSIPSTADSVETQRQRIKQTLTPRLISQPLQGKVSRDMDAVAAARDTGAPVPPLPVYEVIIEVNLTNPAGRRSSRDHLFRLIEQLLGDKSAAALARNRAHETHPYLFATLSAVDIDLLIRADAEQPAPIEREDEASVAQAVQTGGGAADSPEARTGRKTSRAIFRIWEAQKVHPLTTASIRTVKANAAHTSYGALGEGIVWAVLDSGVDAAHPHFQRHDNLSLPAPLTGRSMSFLPGTLPWNQDAFGHGTHVAGIIAGQCAEGAKPQAALQAVDGESSSYRLQELPGVCGMAPMAKLLVLRVLNDDGDGDETALIQAIEYVQQLNDYGRNIVVHGVNISAGFPAHPTWYACGKTPLCVEIDRLVRTGVMVVVAAGNSGHVVSIQNLDTMQTAEAGQTMSINDPGNAALAITVGSTHRESPHTFGISYFSSKGPTSDGRRKPEVVAPGEKIISCASAQRAATANLLPAGSPAYQYIEDTGTSMAAPHVSGILAAFLSIKREFIGQPEDVKQMLMDSATDLHREPSFQGAGLVDLMRLIQSV